MCNYYHPNHEPQCVIARISRTNYQPQDSASHPLPVLLICLGLRILLIGLCFLHRLPGLFGLPLLVMMAKALQNPRPTGCRSLSHELPFLVSGRFKHLTISQTNINQPIQNDLSHKASVLSSSSTSGGCLSYHICQHLWIWWLLSLVLTVCMPQRPYH